LIDEFVNRHAASAVVMVIVDDDDATQANEIGDRSQAESDSIVPVTVDVGQGDAADIEQWPSVLKETLV
jgi:hypothetical protein